MDNLYPFSRDAPYRYVATYYKDGKQHKHEGPLLQRKPKGLPDLLSELDYAAALDDELKGFPTLAVAVRVAYRLGVLAAERPLEPYLVSLAEKLADCTARNADLANAAAALRAKGT